MHMASFCSEDKRRSNKGLLREKGMHAISMHALLWHVSVSDKTGKLSSR